MEREICPDCGEPTLDLRKYRSMMVVSADKALFRLLCPRCGAYSVSLHGIPAPLMDSVRAAAAELGAGMGRDA